MTTPITPPAIAINVVSKKLYCCQIPSNTIGAMTCKFLIALSLGRTGGTTV